MMNLAKDYDLIKIEDSSLYIEYLNFNNNNLNETIGFLAYNSIIEIYDAIFGKNQISKFLSNWLILKLNNFIL